MVKIMTEAMSMVKFSSYRFLGCLTRKKIKMTEKTKAMTDASASVCLILATALTVNLDPVQMSHFRRVELV